MKVSSLTAPFDYAKIKALNARLFCFQSKSNSRRGLLTNTSRHQLSRVAGALSSATGADRMAGEDARSFN
jgi:hypothetical protein